MIAYSRSRTADRQRKKLLPRELMHEVATALPLDQVVKAEQRAEQEGTAGLTAFDCYRRERYVRLLAELRQLVAALDSEAVVRENAHTDFGATHFVQGDPSCFPVFAKFEAKSTAALKLICYGRLAFGGDRAIVLKCEDGAKLDSLIDFVCASPNTDLMLQEVELRWAKPSRVPPRLKMKRSCGGFGQGAERYDYYEVHNENSGQKYMIRIGGGERCRRGETFQNVQIYRNREPYPNFR